MRILQVNTEKTWRGGERQTLYMLEGLRQQGVKVCLLALKGSMMHQRAAEVGIDVIAAKDAFDVWKKLSGLSGQFDCIHAQTGKSHTQCVLTKVFHRIPVVYTRRVDFVPSGLLTKIKYHLTDQVVSISSAIADILSKSEVCTNSPVISSAVKEKALNAERAETLKTSLNIKDQTKVIGLVSALEAHKDPLVALRTIKQLHTVRQDFVVLHFGTGAMLEQVSSAINQLDLADVYLLQGHHSDVEDYFSIMDVFLMTSNEEGLGSSVLDAFCYGVGVVSTNAGGLNNLVKARGFLCNIGDEVCLADGLNEVLSHSKDVIAYQEAAKLYCDNEVGVSTMVSSYIDIYQRLTHE